MTVINYYDELNKAADLIVSDPIKEFTKSVIIHIPERMWKAPSSWSHHLLDERGEWGNALHSIRVTNCSRILASSLLITPEKLDILTCASLLHDIGKRGIKGDFVKIDTGNHPYLVRQIVVNTGIASIPEAEEIYSIIADHMGRWSSRTPAPDFLRTKIVCPFSTDTSKWKECTGVPLAGFPTYRTVDNSMILHLADCVVTRLADIAIKEGLE